MRQVAIDAASIPKDAKIASLEKSSAESEKVIAEARVERMKQLEEVDNSKVSARLFPLPLSPCFCFLNFARFSDDSHQILTAKINGPNNLQLPLNFCPRGVTLSCESVWHYTCRAFPLTGVMISNCVAAHFIRLLRYFSFVRNQLCFLPSRNCLSNGCFWDFYIRLISYPISSTFACI